MVFALLSKVKNGYQDNGQEDSDRGSHAVYVGSNLSLSLALALNDYW